MDAPVVDFPEEWFERSQRSLNDLRFRLERQQRELAVREAELEARARDLQERGERLREAFRTAQESSQDLMGRSHRLREQQRELTEASDAIARDEADVAKARQDLERRAQDLSLREGVVADAERRIRDREAAVVRSERDLERARGEHQRASRAARVLLSKAPDAPETPPSAGASNVLSKLLELQADLEATIARVRSREGEAETLLSEAALRAVEIRELEGSIRAQQDRLEGMRLELVNAKRALLTVDHVLARMPYEVIDGFTKTEEFEEYERALRVLKRLEEAPGRGS